MATWPTDDLTNTHTDQSNDDPGQARAELNALILKAKDIIAGAEAAAVADSVVLRNGDGDVAAVDCNCSGVVNAGSAVFSTSLTVAGVDSSDFSFPSGTKMLFTQAAAPTGWVQDTSQNDRVIRVVSGTGGGTGGSWTVSGLSADNHNHQWYNSINSATSDDQTYNSSGAAISIPTAPDANAPAPGWRGSIMKSFERFYVASYQILKNDTMDDAYTSLSGSGVSSNATWRPAYQDVITATKS